MYEPSSSCVTSVFLLWTDISILLSQSPPPPAHRGHTEQTLERHQMEAPHRCLSRPPRRADPARKGFGIQPPPFPQCRLTPCPLSPRTLSLAEASCRALIQSNTTEDGHRM
ncbi:hypothetical protein AB205_0051780 [Aquarana catesbeiana]|uniref:Uncharacterized protein n=1 Tax=Aquarana catesbeiana TaxID=8400 RepID=A0A2G9SNW3_AQUCT|nr:hypothetical protein AB205_0051780 [Aquarana catesbeiana]